MRACVRACVRVIYTFIRINIYILYTVMSLSHVNDEVKSLFLHVFAWKKIEGRYNGGALVGLSYEVKKQFPCVYMGK